MKYVDTAIGLRIIYLIVRDFTKWPAYKEGAIDKDGNVIDKKIADKSSEWTMLHRIVARIKKLIGKLPGGKSLPARLGTAYFLARDMKEDIEYMTDEALLEKYIAIEESLTDEDIEFVLNEFSGSGIAIAAGTAPDENGDVDPVVRTINNDYTKRNKKASKMIRRNGFTPKTFKMFINGE